MEETCVINGEILFVVDLTMSGCNGTREKNTTNNNDDIVFIIAHERWKGRFQRIKLVSCINHDTVIIF